MAPGSFPVDGHRSRSRAPFLPGFGRALLWWDWGWMECTGWLWDAFGMDGWMDGGAAHPPWSTAAGPGCSCRAFLAFPSLASISSLSFAVPRPFPHVLPVGAPFQVSWSGSAPVMAALPLCSHCGAGIRKNPHGQLPALSLLKIKDLCSPGLG